MVCNHSHMGPGEGDGFRFLQQLQIIQAFAVLLQPVQNLIKQPVYLKASLKQGRGHPFNGPGSILFHIHRNRRNKQPGLTAQQPEYVCGVVDLLVLAEGNNLVHAVEVPVLGQEHPLLADLVSLQGGDAQAVCAAVVIFEEIALAAGDVLNHLLLHPVGKVQIHHPQKCRQTLIGAGKPCVVPLGVNIFPRAAQFVGDVQQDGPRWSRSGWGERNTASP